MERGVALSTNGAAGSIAATALPSNKTDAVEQPTSESLGISSEDLATACTVLEKLGGAGDAGIALFNAKSETMRRLRKAVAPLLEEMRRKFGVGLDEREHKRRAKKRRSARKSQEQALDKQYKDKTRLRAERLAHLNSLMLKDGTPQLLIPDGPSERSDLGSVGASASGNMLQNATVSTGESGLSEPKPDTSDDAKDATLHKPRSCYICKTRFYHLHHFYDQLCPACAELNYSRRKRECDLSGRVCLVTGGRVKIGYQVVLKLLRSGATVIATTRFPKDAAARFAKELDHKQWYRRLHIFGLDFRFIPGVESFCEFLSQRFNRLDAIINNATQTVRRPPAYYSHLIGAERQPLKLLPPAQRATLQSDLELGKQRDQRQILEDTRTHSTLLNSRSHKSIPEKIDGSQISDAQHKRSISVVKDESGSNKRLKSNSGEAKLTTGILPTNSKNEAKPEETSPPFDIEVEASNGDQSAQIGGAGVAVPSSLSSDTGAGSFGNLTSADMSQVPLQQGDVIEDDAIMFPANHLNQSGQQVDLRTHNSWLLKLEDVQTPELLEVLTINTMAPFILNGRLKKLMCSHVCSDVDKYIVNVSAMEGKFYRYKTPNHPHTNMAKAAVNMMTRTSSSDYAKSRIYMNAVDTGWINDENPLQKAQRVFKTHDFQTPIDEIDAAARILDPVFSGVLDGCKEHGKFYKDYKETEW